MGRHEPTTPRITASVRSWRLGLVANNAVHPLRTALQLPECPALAGSLMPSGPACTAPAGRSDRGHRAGPTQLLAGRPPFPPRYLCLYSDYAGFGPTKAKQAATFNPKNRLQPIKCADSGHVTVAGRCFGGALISMVFAARLQGVWSTGGLATSFLHYLTASGGCRDTGGLGSRLDSDLQPPGYYLQLFLPPPPPAASSSVRQPAFLAPPRPRERPARGPASPGSPHLGAWLHEAGEGRAREVPSAPAAPGPGEKVQDEGMESEGRKFISETK